MVVCSSLDNSLIRSYKKSFNGFAAKLTTHEMQRLAGECCKTLAIESS